MFRCYSLKTSHPRLLPQSPKVCSEYLCLFFCLAYLNITHHERNVNQNHNEVPLHISQDGCYPKVYKHWHLFCTVCIVFGVSIFQFVCCPLSEYRIWFYINCFPSTISLWFLFCPWMRCIFFGGFQCLLIYGCSATSCNFGALSGEEEHMSFYSIILLCLLFTFKEVTS